MSSPWFSRKRIGFGVRPASGMGWLVTILVGVLLFAAAHLFRTGVIPSLPLFVAVLAIIAIGFGAIVVISSKGE